MGSQIELLKTKAMATETKTTTENEIQPRGKLVNKIQIQRNYPKHNTEKQMLGKCDSNINRNDKEKS